jgi:hypothetical protein
MRHARQRSSPPTAPVVPLTICMVERSFGRLLVPPARLAHRFASSQCRAPGRTIALPIIAPAAQEEHLPALPKYAYYKTK